MRPAVLWRKGSFGWDSVSSVNLMVVVGGPLLGDVEAGVLAGFVGAPASVLIGGLACIVGAGVVALVSPLRSYERKSSPLT